MGFNKMSNVTHAMEDVLSLLRQHELTVNAEIVNALFEALDLLEVLAQGITEGREEDIEIAGIIQNLQKFSTKEAMATETEQTSERRRNLQLRYLPAEIEQIKRPRKKVLISITSTYTCRKIVCSRVLALL